MPACRASLHSPAWWLEAFVTPNPADLCIQHLPVCWPASEQNCNSPVSQDLTGPPPTPSPCVQELLLLVPPLLLQRLFRELKPDTSLYYDALSAATEQQVPATCFLGLPGCLTSCQRAAAAAWVRAGWLGCPDGLSA